MTPRGDLLRWMREGRYRWGYTTQSTGRYGAIRITVNVYPPGIHRDLRRCSHAIRLWPPVMLVAGVALTAIDVIVAEVPLGIATVSTLGFLLLVGGVLMQVSSPIRSRTISVVASSHVTVDEPSRHYSDVRYMLARLQDAEDQYERGTLTWRQYEQRWASAYAQARDLSV